MINDAFLPWMTDKGSHFIFDFPCFIGWVWSWHYGRVVESKCFSVCKKTNKRKIDLEKMIEGSHHLTPIPLVFPSVKLAESVAWWC